ncbi:MAG: hypothetical protein EOP00_00320 [Pedobacter sp.]|nr:MAG: hypothetical protein EOP00_00320 [Pedobacter sp.]
MKTKVLNLFPINVIWFADRPNPFKCINSQYKQSSYHKIVLGYWRTPFFTKVIDLSQDLAIIETQMPAKTAYEIRRGIKDGINTTLEIDIDHFIDFYNEFAKIKKLKPLNAKLKEYLNPLIITKSRFDGKDLVMHAYVSDRQSMRVRLLHSASLFRAENSTADKATIGRANRLLHYKDICMFKELGYTTYDLGGYALGTVDVNLSSINQFKDGFGATLLQESDFLPLPGVFLSFLHKILRS